MVPVIIKLIFSWGDLHDICGAVMGLNIVLSDKVPILKDVGSFAVHQSDTSVFQMSESRLSTKNIKISDLLKNITSSCHSANEFFNFFFVSTRIQVILSSLILTFCYFEFNLGGSFRLCCASQVVVNINWWTQ